MKSPTNQQEYSLRDASVALEDKIDGEFYLDAARTLVTLSLRVTKAD